VAVSCSFTTSFSSLPFCLTSPPIVRSIIDYFLDHLRCFRLGIAAHRFLWLMFFHFFLDLASGFPDSDEPLVSGNLVDFLLRSLRDARLSLFSFRHLFLHLRLFLPNIDGYICFKIGFALGFFFAKYLPLGVTTPCID